MIYRMANLYNLFQFVMKNLCANFVLEIFFKLQIPLITRMFKLQLPDQQGNKAY